jgi:hypothetical protein
MSQIQAPKSDSKRLLWALALSSLLHGTAIAAYVLTPWLRTLLAFNQMKKPAIQLDMGVPLFVDLIEDLKNAKPEAPQEPEKVEPPKVEDPPKVEEPEKVAIKPPSKDTYIEPVKPKTKPVSQPASNPTSLAMSQPATAPTSIAATQPATKPVKGGGVPLVATGLADVMPATSKWMVLLGTAQMRESPSKEDLAYAMRNFVFTDGEPLNKTGMDALDDVEEVMLSTPNPWVTKDRFAFIIRLKGTQEQAKKKMEETAAKSGTKLISDKINGHDILRWESEAKQKDAYVFAFLSQDVMVIGIPATMQQFFPPKAASQPTKPPVITQASSQPVVEAPPRTLNKIMVERGKAPAILIAVSDIGRTFPIKAMFGYDWGGYVGFLKLPPQPLFFRAAFNTLDNSNASFEAAFLTEQDAVAGASAMNGLMGPLTAIISTQKPFDLLVPIAKKIKFKVYGKTIRADIDITSDEAKILLQGFEPIIKGEAPEDAEGLPPPPLPTSEPTAPNGQPSPISPPSVPLEVPTAPTGGVNPSDTPSTQPS